MSIAEATVITEDLNYDILERLRKDLKGMAALLGQREVRSLVDLYYQTQHYRIATAGQERSSERDEPTELIKFFRDQSHQLELNLKNALKQFADTYFVGRWMQSICGIGPVISAGLLAHLDVRDKMTPCPFWSFAGLDPSRKWVGRVEANSAVKRLCATIATFEEVSELGAEFNRKPDGLWAFATTNRDGSPRKASRANVASALSRRPYAADVKTLTAFKSGECFVKVQGNKNDFYGKLFRERRDKEEKMNNAGQFKEQAAKALEEKNYSKSTDAYKAYIEGKLPPAHLHARARRYAVKMFLSHVHLVMYTDLYGEAPIRPPIFSNTALNPDGRHVHFIEPPNWPFPEGGKSLKELYALE